MDDSQKQAVVRRVAFFIAVILRNDNYFEKIEFEYYDNIDNKPPTMVENDSKIVAYSDYNDFPYMFDFIFENNRHITTYVSLNFNNKENDIKNISIRTNNSDPINFPYIQHIRNYASWNEAYYQITIDIVKRYLDNDILNKIKKSYKNEMPMQ